MRSNVRQAALLIGGGLLGAIVGLPIAYLIQLQLGKQQLERYASRVLRAGEAGAAEASAAVATVHEANKPLCSDDDLNVMRGFVFDASYVKDLGRVKNGQLVCTAAQGRLPQPVQMPAAAGFRQNEVQIRPNASLLSSTPSTGVLIVGQDVAAVLNPASYNALDDPPMRYISFLYDSAQQKLVRAFGGDDTLDPALIVAQKPFEQSGRVYVPLCAQESPLCVVAFESKADIVGQTKAFLFGLPLLGSLGGILAGLSLALLYLRQRSIEFRLHRAVRERKLKVVYQPIVDLDSARPVGAEALVRWTDEAGEQVSPDMFIPIAEQRGFVGEITRLVLDRVVDELGPLLRSGGIRVTVNMAAQDLSDPRFFSHVESCVARAGIPTNTLAFELTERSTADKKTALNAIARLQDAGHAIYIDDFGTGYSSLAYLQDLHVDAIKLDRAFTKTVGTGAVTATVVPQILDIAKELELMMVVEGIETFEQAEFFLRARRGMRGQGWLFGKPLPAADFQEFLRTH